MQCFAHERYWREDFVKICGVLRRSTVNPIVGALSSAGLGPGDILPTIYELIPYSFVVDYFTNLGDVISAWSHQAIRPDWAQRTVGFEKGVSRELQDNTSQYIRSTSKVYLGNSFVPGKFKRTEGTISRSSGLPSDALPELHFELPNAHQIVNLAFLFDGFRRISTGFGKIFGSRD
jgi:hypothetical protein